MFKVKDWKYKTRMRVAIGITLLFVPIIFFSPFMLIALFMTGLVKIGSYVGIGVFFSFLIFAIVFPKIMPSLEEQTQNAILDFANAATSKNKKDKLKKINRLNLVLENLTNSRKFGFSIMSRHYFKKYFSSIVVPLSLSKNEDLLKEIQISFHKIDIEDPFTTYNSLNQLHNKLKKYPEFETLYVVYPSLKNNISEDPIALLKNIDTDRPRGKIRIIWSYLEQKSLDKLFISAAVFFLLTLLGKIFGLFDFFPQVVNALK